MQLWQDMIAILKAPFAGTQLDIVDLFWLIGLIIVILLAWMMIIEHIEAVKLEV
jgi:hypothetical protein